MKSLYTVQLRRPIPDDELEGTIAAVTESLGNISSSTVRKVLTKGVGKPLIKPTSMDQASQLAVALHSAGAFAQVIEHREAPEISEIGQQDRVEKVELERPLHPVTQASEAQFQHVSSATVAARSGIATPEIIGLTGVALLILGVFSPLFRGPFGMSLNYIGDGRGDGWFILLFAVIGAVLALLGRTRWVWIPGVLSLALTGYTFFSLSQGLAEMRRTIGTDTSESSGITGLLMGSTGLSWGWAPLFLGGLALLFAAWITGQSRARSRHN